MKKITLYGIPNCDVVKKTFKWLDAHKITYDFHDYKQSGISKEKLAQWCKENGWETIFNKRSTTWKELPVAEQEGLKGEADAIRLMIAHNSIIKRPVIEYGKGIIVGYNEAAFIKHLK